MSDRHCLGAIVAHGDGTRRRKQLLHVVNYLSDCVIRLLSDKIAAEAAAAEAAAVERMGGLEGGQRHVV